MAGYILYRRQGPSPAPFEAIGTYPEENLANPLNPRATATDLQSNTAYYFAVTAYDTDGNESAFSNRVCVENGAACQGSGGSSSSGGGGGGGGGGG